MKLKNDKTFSFFVNIEIYMTIILRLIVLLFTFEFMKNNTVNIIEVNLITRYLLQDPLRLFIFLYTWLVCYMLIGLFLHTLKDKYRKIVFLLLSIILLIQWIDFMINLNLYLKLK